MERYGSAFTQAGYIAELGNDLYKHRFGGSSWNIVDEVGDCGSPTLLLTLDLNDPRLGDLCHGILSEIPLCSHMNCAAYQERQIFQIDTQLKRARCIERNRNAKVLDHDLVTANPLPEQSIRLRKMGDSEVPASEERYATACDTFLGGSSFIRVLGSVLWLQDPYLERCPCGLDRKHIASIGYERYDQPAGYIPGRPFFLGECALYFFLCSACLQVTVISQSS